LMANRQDARQLVWCSGARADLREYGGVEPRPRPRDLIDEIGRKFLANEVFAPAHSAVWCFLPRLGAQTAAVHQDNGGPRARCVRDRDLILDVHLVYGDGDPGVDRAGLTTDEKAA